jgi:uncharacterized protein (UPF0264 family)
LLVSVRSAAEARWAAGAGAALIDVKEPDRGPLGRAECGVWREVSQALPPSIPLSVALGELSDWLGPNQPALPADAWASISLRKLGLAGTTTYWRQDWRGLRSRLGEDERPAWIAVVYADWQSASAPDPDAIVDAACESPSIVGVLVDTWSKIEPFRVDAAWIAWARRVRAARLTLAVAGGLNRESIPGLARLAPDIIAVRGAACVEGRRRGVIDPRRVAELAIAVAALPAHPAPSSILRLGDQRATSNLTPWASGRSAP